MPLPDLKTSISVGLEYLDEHGLDVPPSYIQRAIRVGAIKALGDVTAIMTAYHDSLTQILINFFESSKPVTSFKNAFKRAAVIALSNAFDLGFSDGGCGYPGPEDNNWFNARLEQEFGYIEMLFQEARELRNEPEFDFFSWITQRADGYTRTVKELYNVGKLRCGSDVMVTFDGNDGAESCDTCQMLKGQRHRVSWFVRRNYVPPHGVGLDCHPGRRCQHYLVDDKGKQLTV